MCLSDVVNTSNFIEQIYFLKIHFNIIIPPSGLFPAGFPSNTLYAAVPVPHTCHMHHPSHSLWFDNMNDVWLAEQMMKLLIMQFSPFSCCFLLLRPSYLLPQNPILQHPQPMFLSLGDQVSHPHKTRRILFLCVSICIFVDSKEKTKDSGPHDSRHSLNSVHLIL